MSTRSEREFLKVQLLETQHLREMVAEHPLMSQSFAEREAELEAKLDALPLGDKEARAVLFFSGDPVQGSKGIEAGFAARVLEPFQGMVAADYADRWHGRVGSRGRALGESESRLLLTGLPRGSFGLELTQADNGNLFSEGQLADTLAHVTRLIDAAGKSDEDFATELGESAPRVIRNLRSFLEIVAKGRAGLRLESGDFRCILNPSQAQEAFIRAASTMTAEETIISNGILKGVLLDDWRFDFADEGGTIIGGKIDEDLEEETVIDLNRRFFNEHCRATVLRTKVNFRNGRTRTTYILKGIESLKECAGAPVAGPAQ